MIIAAFIPDFNIQDMHLFKFFKMSGVDPNLIMTSKVLLCNNINARFNREYISTISVQLMVRLCCGSIY